MKATRANAQVAQESTEKLRPVSPLVQRELPPTIEVNVRVPKEGLINERILIVGTYITPRIDDQGGQHGGDDILVMVNSARGRIDEEIEISGKVRIHTVNGRNGTMPDEFIGVQIIGFLSTIGKGFATNNEQLPIPENIPILELIETIHEMENIVVDERQQRLLSALAQSDIGKARLDIRKYFRPLPPA